MSVGARTPRTDEATAITERDPDEAVGSETFGSSFEQQQEFNRYRPMLSALGLGLVLVVALRRRRAASPSPASGIARRGKLLTLFTCLVQFSSHAEHAWEWAPMVYVNATEAVRLAVTVVLSVCLYLGFRFAYWLVMLRLVQWVLSSAVILFAYPSIATPLTLPLGALALAAVGLILGSRDVAAFLEDQRARRAKRSAAQA